MVHFEKAGPLLTLPLSFISFGNHQPPDYPAIADKGKHKRMERGRTPLFEGHISAINFQFFNHRKCLDLVFISTGMMLPEIFDSLNMSRLKIRMHFANQRYFDSPVRLEFFEDNKKA